MTTLPMNFSQTAAPKASKLQSMPGAHLAMKVVKAIVAGMTAHREYRALVMQGAASRDAAAEAIARGM